MSGVMASDFSRSGWHVIVASHANDAVREDIEAIARLHRALNPGYPFPYALPDRP